MRKNFAFFELRKSEIRASLCVSNQIFLFLEQLLENNAKQTDNFFWTYMPRFILAFPYIKRLKFGKRKRKV